MKQVLNPSIAIPIIVFALIVSWVMWYTFVRAVPEEISEGTIVARYFREKTKVKKEIPRISRNLEHMSQKIEYTLPDRFIYDIQLDGIDKLAHFSIPAIGTSSFDVGTRVKVVYVERSFPLIWKKIYVKEIFPMEIAGE